MGPYQDGQAELLRVTYADFNCLVLPPDGKEREASFTLAGPSCLFLKSI
jgi:glutathione-independent formaldehyde dehydrogenase